jgi:hypothetical protein
MGLLENVSSVDETAYVEMEVFSPETMVFVNFLESLEI